MKKLLELEAKLRKAKEELEKAAPKVNMGHSSFTMDHVNEIANMKDHKAAKERAHSIVDKSTANPKNKAKMKMMINGSKNTNHLAQGMSNHVLAHPSEGLKVIKSDIKKNATMGYGSDTGMPMGTAGSGDVNMVKEEKHEDEKEDKKMMAEAMDEHNEKKHGEPKDKDSAYKDMNVKKGCNELVKFGMNGQWSLMGKGDTMDMKPDGEFDVPVKEVYDGDDAMDHAGNRSVDGSDKGKTVKESDTEKKLLKD